jgi:heterodisulfide reductase subunit A
MTAIKQALLLDKAVPCAEPWIFYTDIRAFGKGYEEFYAKTRGHLIPFIRGRVAEVIPNSSSLTVKAMDTLLGKQIEEQFDLVVLSPALIPNKGTKELANMLGIDIGPDGFFLEAHHKLKGVETKRHGIFLAGAALGPKDIHESTMEALAAASKVATFLGRGEKSVSPEVAYLIPGRCDLCGICVDQCPSKAIEKGKNEVIINPISCNGCSICIPICPKQALDLKNTTEEQLIAQIKGIFKGESSTPRIIAFIQKRTAYDSVDLGGQMRRSYSPEIRIIKVPGIARLGIKHILHAFAAGADGIIFVEGDDSIFNRDLLRKRVLQFKNDLRKFGINILRLQPAITTLPQYERTLNLFDVLVGRVKKMSPITQEKREKIKKYLAGEIIDE